ncbi:hypothetical protein EDD16DRAFT_1019729 [Pisolithus croceorrhizus]|nr:hypothetical protein EDD16DRAFT_1019729 [Pisolithus croceorrhizus]
MPVDPHLHAVKDLANAQAELARLQRRESELVQELVDMRKAVAAQKVVVDELVVVIDDLAKASATQHIERLPNELLAEAFLYIKDEWHNLVSVSRRWRAVIIDTPGFWSEINLDRYCSVPTLLKLHLERSRQTPLTLVLGSYDQELLDIVMLHANRLHTLRINGHAPQILSRITHVRLPSLQHLAANVPEDLVNLLPAIHPRIPSLKRLELGISSASSMFYGYLGNDIPRRSPPHIIAAESLEELSLTSFIFDWEFQQDSIQFPLLRRLTLDVSCPVPFLEVLVAPKLTHICFTGGYCGAVSPREFSGTWSKFDNVTHITFALSRFEHAVNEQALSLCPIFRETRYADIHVEYVPMMFNSSLTGHGQIPADHWTCLESLSIRNFTFSSLDAFEDLVAWFTQRRDSGQRKLHFKLIHEDQAHDLVTLNTSHTLYQTLQECCASVVLDGVPLSAY